MAPLPIQTLRIFVHGIVVFLWLAVWYECYILFGKTWDPGAILMKLAVGFICYTYYLSCTVSPGHPDPQRWSGGDAPVESIPPPSFYRVRKKNPPKTKKWYKKGGRPYCGECKVIKPTRTHHCSVCDRCVLRMDHHCQWTGNCQGHYNYKYFFLFLMSVTLATASGGLIMLTRLHFHGFPDHPFDIAIFVTAGVQCCVVFISVGQLFVYHVKRILTNSTTLEDETTYYNILEPDSKRYPYDLGNWKENAQVFLGPDPLLWFLPIDNVSREDSLAGDAITNDHVV